MSHKPNNIFAGRDLSCKQIQVDEIWGFIGAKRKNARKAGAYGDVWTFIALDADTQLIPSFAIGKRDAYPFTIRFSPGATPTTSQAIPEREPWPHLSFRPRVSQIFPARASSQWIR